MIDTAPPKVLAASSVMSLATPAVSVVAPAMERLPLSVISALVVADRLPLIVDAPRTMEPTSSISVTFRPLTTLTAPPNPLSLSSVMSFAAPAVSVVVPEITMSPLSVIEPLAVTVRLPLTVEAPRSMAPVSLSDTFRPLTTLTAPPKLLESLSVMSLAEPAVRVVVPATDRLPLSVIEPLAVTARLPLIVEAPKSRPAMVLRVTFLPLTTLTAPTAEYV